MTVFINPGSGPVPDASLPEAVKNIRAFEADLRATGLDAVAVPYGTDCGDGRYAFTVIVNTPAGTQPHEVEMPGLPLDRVRWVDEPDQNIWDFPRLYVDGSSWVWQFALGMFEPEDTE